MFSQAWRGKVVDAEPRYAQSQLPFVLNPSEGRLQQQIVDRGLEQRVGLLSISFDPENDDAAALRDYAGRMRADPATWRVVTLASPQDRRQLLDAFGNMVIARPLGEFEHNASLQIVDAHGILIRIVDFDDIDRPLDVAVAAAR